MFKNWLNIIDGLIGRDARLKAATVLNWQQYFKAGYSEQEAIKELLGLDYMPQIPE